MPIAPIVRYPLTIDPIGDSLTANHGATDDNGWRKYLYDQAQVAGYPIDFVGFTASGDFPDNQHSGISGSTVATCAMSCQQHLGVGGNTKYQPRAVMLLIGSADVLAKTPTAEIGKQYHALCESILQLDTALEALAVATIPPLPGNPPEVEQYNALLSTIWDQLAHDHPSLRIVRIDTYQAIGGVYTTDLFVGLHPNDAGYLRMSQAYWSAMEPVFDELTRTAH